MTAFDLYTQILLRGGTLRVEEWCSEQNRPYLKVSPQALADELNPHISEHVENLMVFALVDTLTEFMNRLWSYEKQFGWRNEAIPVNDRYEASVFHLELRDVNYRRLDTKRQERAKEEEAA